MQTTEQEFKRLYMCDFKSDERLQALEDRLALYYEQTPDSMDNRTAMKYWKQFRWWCRCFGYSADEINKAKRSGRFRHI